MREIRTAALAAHTLSGFLALLAFSFQQRTETSHGEPQSRFLQFFDNLLLWNFAPDGALDGQIRLLEQ
ncbi:hypothetical protein WK22_12380 [Burkholderia multivorans]|nr:hypothetical protein WK22_12380 [Burkholderia multivorans]KOE22463.1 hypothetical protein AI46_29820 [Burkholderia multivorans R-20526]